MLPEDERHGSGAGYSAHRREDTMCDPCLLAGRRQAKVYRHARHNGGPKRVPLGTEGWELLNTWNLAALSEKSGIHQQQLQRTKEAGPDAVVHRRNQMKILAAGRPVTALGIARRLQALSALGWSMSSLAQRVRIERSNLDKLRLQTRPTFIRRTTIKSVCAAYEELSMKLPEPSRSVSHVRNHARANGWLPPLAWDDIDDPKDNGLRNKNMEPEFTKKSLQIDRVVVERFLNGDTYLNTTVAEKREIVRLWPATGRPLADLERIGWKPERYVDREDGAA